MSLLLPATTLAWRELQRFVRQRSRLIGALGTPVIFWVLIGSGLGSSFSTAVHTGGADYLDYFFPGTLALVIVFTAIFSSMSLIEDRHEGFLQGVLAAPAPRFAIALGKISGGTILATGQGVLLLLLVPFTGVPLSWSAVPIVVLTCMLVSFALSGLGFALAWKVDSSQGFHAVMNLILLPMWILSGALFPADGAAGWLRVLLRINPLTYGVAAIRHALYPVDALSASALPAFGLSLALTALFGLGAFLLATYQVNRHAYR